MSAAFNQSFSRSTGYRLPARPLIKFALPYVLERGFLDSRPGFTYALLQSIYEAFIQADDSFDQ